MSFCCPSATACLWAGATSCASPLHRLALPPHAPLRRETAALGKAAAKPRPGDLCQRCSFTPLASVPLPNEDGGESSSAAEPPQTLRVVQVDGQELSLGQARLLSGKRGTFAEVVSMLLRNPNFPLYLQPELLGTSSSALELPPGVEGVSHAVRCIAYSTMAATMADSEGAAGGRNVWRRLPVRAPRPACHRRGGQDELLRRRPRARPAGGPRRLNRQAAGHASARSRPVLRVRGS